MKSITTKIMLLTVFAIIISIITATFFGVYTIRKLGRSNSEQMLLLMCETGQKNLNYYFESVEHSVAIVSNYTQEDLNNIEIDDLENHMERVKSIFQNVASSANGVLTYYYRIEPGISDTIDGFWFIKSETEGFIEHEVTDISQYDMDDTTKLVWFTVPRKTGQAIWLPPYITENLGERVFSYNVPIKRGNTFFGVVGIEINYSTVATQVDNIKLFQNGYAFINDAKGNIIYHPLIDVTQLTEENKPKVPKGLLSPDKFIDYNYEGVEKEAVWLTLSNGMRLNVSVPVSEINGNWKQLIAIMIGVSVILLFVFILITFYLTLRIVKPIQELSEGAKQVDDGNYDVKLKYEKDDEIGALTKTFNSLTSHLKGYISELNSLAYDDPLTSVHNKGAFDATIKKLQKMLIQHKGKAKFAIAIFDCDKLKRINDKYGHKCGDIYIKTASNLICLVFANSLVYRIGGDEFAVIVKKEDFANRDKLIKIFEQKSAEISKAAQNQWSEIHVSVGLAVYDPETDANVDSVINRADKLMYEHKRRKNDKIGE